MLASAMRIFMNGLGTQRGNGASTYTFNPTIDTNNTLRLHFDLAGPQKFRMLQTGLQRTAKLHRAEIMPGLRRVPRGREA